MSGTLRCHRQEDADTVNSFGDYFAIYNSTGNVTAILAHTAGIPETTTPDCWPFAPNTDVPVVQGQFIGVGNHSGTVVPPGPGGDHIHFQLNDGNNQIQSLISAPFTMSDHEPSGGSLISFTDVAANDGPSDNAGIGYVSQEPVNVDSGITSAYLAQGGASASWWAIGAPWATGGGPCIFTINAFVHTCSTQHGTLRLQNYIRIITNEPSAMAKNASQSATYWIRGTTWRAMGGAYRGTVVSNALGPPAGNQSTVGSIIRQNFADGRIDRYTDRVRQDVFEGGVWRATYYYQTGAPGECFDVNSDTFVDLGDALSVIAHFGEIESVPPFDPRYDISHDGATELGDALLVLNGFDDLCLI